MSTRMPKLVQRYGFKRFLVIGPLTIVAGMLWLSQLHTGSNYWFGILPAAIVMPLGIGMTMMPTIAAATSGVPSHESGIASGLISTSQQMGGALGLSILSGVAASVTANAVHPTSTDAAIQGYHVAFLVSAGFMLLAALVALVVIRGRDKPISDETESYRTRRLQSSAIH